MKFLVGTCMLSLATTLPFQVFADNQYPDAQTYTTMPYRGVSLSGGEFQADPSNVLAQTGAFFPTIYDSLLFLYNGMNVYRIPIAWEYVADNNGNLGNVQYNGQNTGQAYLTQLDATISSLTAQGAYVIIDLHNYMRYNPSNVSLDWQDQTPNGSDIIGSGSAAPTLQAFANLWTQLATRYNNPHVIYALMNEPHDVDVEQVVAAYNGAIAGIRNVEKSKRLSPHLILLGGDQWSGLHSWMQPLPTWDDPSHSGAPRANSAVFPQEIKDPGNNIALDVHQYFDADASGTYVQQGYSNGDCMSEQQFEKTGWNYNGQNWPSFDSYWGNFLAWAKPQHVKFILGEFGVPNTPTCIADVNYLLSNFNNSGYVYNTQQPVNGGAMGWVVWSAGSSWGDYILSVAPGGPQNSLMWNNLLYQNYLTPAAPLPPLSPKVMAITNNTATTLNFSSGFWPFQSQGSADLAPTSTAYLYSTMPNTNTPPNVHYGLVYHLGSDTSHTLGIGIDTKGGANGEFTYSWADPALASQFSVTQAPSSECGITGDNNHTDRCYVVNPTGKNGKK